MLTWALTFSLYPTNLWNLGSHTGLLLQPSWNTKTSPWGSDLRLQSLKVGIISISFHIWLIRYKNLQNIYFFLDGIWCLRADSNFIISIQSTLYFTDKSCFHAITFKTQIPWEDNLQPLFLAKLLNRVMSFMRKCQFVAHLWCPATDCLAERFTDWNWIMTITATVTRSPHSWQHPKNKTLAPSKCQSEKLLRKCHVFKKLTGECDWRPLRYDWSV